MPDNFEFLDTTNHKRLIENLNKVADKWGNSKDIALEEGNKAHYVLMSFFESFATDLITAFEGMVDKDGDETSS